MRSMLLPVALQRASEWAEQAARSRAPLARVVAGRVSSVVEKIEERRLQQLAMDYDGADFLMMGTKNQVEAVERGRLLRVQEGK